MRLVRSSRKSKSHSSVAASTRGLSHRLSLDVTVWTMPAKVLSAPDVKSASAFRHPCDRSSERSSRTRRKNPRVSPVRSEEHTSELQLLMSNSYAVFCLKKKKQQNNHKTKT